MTNSKLINYNVALRSELDARMERMRASRREIVATAKQRKAV